MKKVEKNGKIYYQWEPEEHNAQQAFERTVLAEKSVEPLMTALLKAQGEAAQETAKAWRQVSQKIADQFPEFRQSAPISYDWINGTFTASLHNVSDEDIEE